MFINLDYVERVFDLWQWHSLCRNILCQAVECLCLCRPGRILRASSQEKAKLAVRPEPVESWTGFSCNPCIL